MIGRLLFLCVLAWGLVACTKSEDQLPEGGILGQAESKAISVIGQLQTVEYCAIFCSSGYTFGTGGGMAEHCADITGLPHEVLYSEGLIAVEGRLKKKAPSVPIADGHCPSLESVIEVERYDLISSPY